MQDYLILFIALFVCLYTIPSIILALLQSKHIKAEMLKPAILLESEDYRIAGEYALASLKLDIISKVVEAVVFVLWVSFGLSFLNTIIQSIAPNINPLWQGVALVLSFVIIESIIDLPLSIYKTFGLDKRFHFSNQTPRIFIADLFKTLFLSIILGGIVATLLISIIDNIALWWIAGFIALLAIVILVNFIYPTLIAPLFNKFTPLDDENLKSRIESLMNSIGFKSSGIFVVDASKHDGRLNAYFGGFGKSKRVVLFDTLLDKISADGLIAILGHELGHFKHNDIFKNIIIMACVLFALFFVVGHLPSQLFDTIGLAHNGASILVLMLLISPIIGFWFMPLIGYFSRKAEYAADEFGAGISSKHCLANALVRLVNENKSFPSSHPAYIFFYYTHPPLLQRLKALNYEA
ncbi:M48 family metallopeptidase [Helicobacter typhlonius]|uniref:M48 family metallopeptidase n=2 Tax=Helicobacter typhlonius TaxID=76936 RepID=UPI002FE1F856